MVVFLDPNTAETDLNSADRKDPHLRNSLQINTPGAGSNPLGYRANCRSFSPLQKAPSAARPLGAGVELTAEGVGGCAEPF
jgi:hypothetical protein